MCEGVTQGTHSFQWLQGDLSLQIYKLINQTQLNCVLI